MRRRLVLLLYNVLLPVGLLVSIPAQVMKMIRRGNYGRDFMQRFGIYRPEVKERLRRGCDIWVHAVSVGEVLIARKLLEELSRRDDSLRLVLSTTTSTGYALAQGMESESLTAIYNPVDLWGVVRRTFSQIRPRMMLLVEAEIWPNLVSRARREGIPVILVNARLSPRSEARYRRLQAVTTPIFSMLEAVFVQSEEDEGRWAGLGVAPEKVVRMGSIKFDADDMAGADAARLKLFEEILGDFDDDEGKRPVLLVGSSHPGEEKLLAGVYLRVCEAFPRLLLVVVPRHVERTAEVLDDLKSVGLEGRRRSKMGDAAGAGGWADANREGGRACLVIDTTGELSDWYRVADLVVIGKSFLAKGGQNPVEAIMAGKPVFFGPHMENFAVIVDGLKAARAVEQADGAEELASRLLYYLRNPGEAVALSGRAGQVLGEHAGATRRSVDWLLARRGGETVKKNT
jgi:3-deoxy-D-manno-octulosonic-acid transferase